jgi:hypothetical protein
MLNEKKQELHSLLLTPTERAFLRATAFDALLAGPESAGYSLHYLDPNAEVLATYRGLALIHRPNWYKGTRMSTPFSAVRAGSLEGEFTHPGEASRLESLLKKQRRLDLKRQQYAEREAAWAARLAGWEKEGRSAGTASSEKDEQTAEPLPCATCGQITLDYWSTFFDGRGRKLCRCRECLDRAA